MDWWPTKLNGCTKHIEPQHREHMECDGMNRDIVNQYGKHQWYNDVIHVQAEKGWEDGNVEGINTLKVDDYMCAVHDVWWCVKPIPATYKWPQPGQGTCGRHW
jgi:hypothetical protein